MLCMAYTESLVWRELLTPVEIQQWLSSGKAPKRLREEFSCPGVYRFTFPTAVDGAASHTPCYVGEATNLSNRIRKHFKKDKPGGRRINPEKLKPGWALRGGIRNSRGDFKLETLKLEGRVSFGGFTFGPENFADDPHENFFVRKMLENWALLSSEHRDGLHPLNLRNTKTKNIFAELSREAKKRAPSAKRPRK
jgi:hypothetical protein